ncbi:MAG: hypothetical protein JW973_08330 [Bacteroidales bacterium]|nr:hypothetical protein [Bacteroidales bacterium]
MHFNYKRIFALIIVLFIAVFPPLSGQTRTVKKAEKKRELIQKLHKKHYQKIRKKTIKHRREIQTKTTQKSMKEADKRARRYNRKNQENWLEKHFCRKRPKR